MMPLVTHFQNNVANMSQPLPSSNIDPYDGFMTYREKRWVASIQIMQISANPSYQDDYYYIVSV